jgi:hypothetical protein
VDGQVKVWDIRTYQPLHAYFANTPATQLDISQRGLLAVGQGRRVQVRPPPAGQHSAARSLPRAQRPTPCHPRCHLPLP